MCTEQIEDRVQNVQTETQHEGIHPIDECENT